MAHRGVTDGSLQISEGKAHGDDPASSCFWLVMVNGTPCTPERSNETTDKYCEIFLHNVTQTSCLLERNN